MADAKPNPRPKIDYPPFETREWIPPDLRPKKKPKPKYVKPEGISQRLAISSLVKIWNQFRVYDDRHLLLGSFAETHKRFRLRSNGYQTPCNCIVAIVYSHFIPMSKWDFSVIDNILYMGNDLYMSTIHHQSDRTKTYLLLCEVYPSFYYGDTKVTTSVKGTKYCGLIFEDCQDPAVPYFSNVIVEFFEEHASGIITVGKRHLAVWVADCVLYLFDPTEHDRTGHPWKGLRGMGFAACMRFKTYDNLVSVVYEKFCHKCRPKFTITPCSIIRLVKIATEPPPQVCEKEPPVCGPKHVTVCDVCEEEQEKEICSILIEREEVPDDDEEECDINDEYSPEVGQLEMSPSEYERQGLPLPEGAERSPITECPLQCRRVKSITYYTTIIQEKMGILRASTHQCDPCYTVHNGKQSFANAVMALTMLRVYKSKEWFKKMLDDILKFGEKYYGDCLKANPPKSKMKISNIATTISLYDVCYIPEVYEYFTIGRLQSTDTGVLDLLPALQEFFRCSPTCVITGPLVLATWFEDGYYYMFDPNERDCRGRVLRKCIETCGQIQLLDYCPGFACVTWFSDLKDLVDLYMINIPPSKRRQQFLLSRVIIKDWYCVAPDYHEYEGLSPCKWILRGTFNENDRRFQKEVRNTQGTAAAALALALDYLKPARLWTTADVDEILLLAEEYHMDTINHLKSINKFVNSKLLVTELLRQFTLDCTEVTMEIGDCAVYGIIEGCKTEPVYDLNTGICKFFVDNEYGILTCRGLSVAIWKLCGCFYYYDPHSRDEEGFRNFYGTACVLRFMKSRQLALCLISNLEPGVNDTFNITSLRFTVWEKDENGVIRPPLHHYKSIGPFTSILRTCSSERSPRFNLNAGKQTIPMCLVAVAMMKLVPSTRWTVDIMEEILSVGDRLFTDTMVDRETQDNLPDQNDIDEVYAENCILTFNIGMNKFTIEYQTPMTGNFEHHFKPKMEKFYAAPQTNFDDEKELFITNDFYTVMTWFDGKVYYLFDPKPRDAYGQIYGKEEWSAKIDMEGEEGEDLDYGRLQEAALEKLGGSGDGNAISAGAIVSIGKKEGEDEGGDLIVKHSPSFWREQEENGTACTLWFLTFDKLIEHVYENTPPNRRRDLKFKLYPIIVHNKPDLKNCFDPELSGREDNYSGSWYEFKEVDYGRWILRGWFYNMYIMFPEENRGKQQLAMCYVAIAYAKRYDVRCYDTITVNDILKYGDRLYTATRGKCKDDLADEKNLGLTVQECEALLCRQWFGIDELLTKFCIAKDEIKVKIITNITVGDIHAKPTSKILNVPRGLKDFFGKGVKYGIFMCRNYIVAIWRGVNVYYLFDSNSRGPCGLYCPGGEACITRYLDTDVMADVILYNIGKEEIARYAIHQVRLCFDSCPRGAKEEEKEEEPEQPKYTGIACIVPGKCILRGSLSQEDEVFGRGPNVQSAAIAIIALSMSLVHKPCTWTMPIVDDILYLGDELYGASLEKLGYEYNPWEQGLTVALVNRDYKVGSLRANFEIRSSDHRGVIDIKHPTILSLRQGIEKFFCENSYGIIETDPLTVAVWEEDEQPGYIYMYDPNPRGIAGVYTEGGTACLMVFKSFELATEHFLSNITDKDLLSGEFIITAVEIVVDNVRTKQKGMDVCRCKPGEYDLDRRNPKTLCDKKHLRKLAEDERKRKEALRIAKVGKHDYYTLKNGDAILRGSRSQSSKYFSKHSRGNQDIPNCLAAFVVHRLSPVGTWHFKHIDMILEVGDQLYKDSYVTYNPKDRKLGMANVLRKIYIKEVEVTLVIYRPVMKNALSLANLELALINYFQQEAFGILSAENEHVALFFKEGYYYTFDPHSRDVDGNKAKDGVACVMKFDNITNMVAKYCGNIPTMSCNTYFSITLVTIGSIVKMGTMGACCVPHVN